MVYKSQLIGYKKPTDHQNLSVFQLPYENQPFRSAVFSCKNYLEAAFAFQRAAMNAAKSITARRVIPTRYSTTRERNASPVKLPARMKKTVARRIAVRMMITEESVTGWRIERSFADPSGFLRNTIAQNARTSNAAIKVKAPYKSRYSAVKRSS